MDLGISGKWALVSGSSRGLGRACATSLAREGVNVVLCARHGDAGEQVARELGETFGVTAHFVVADVSTPEGRRIFFEQHVEPDILVTNAAGPSLPRQT